MLEASELIGLQANGDAHLLEHLRPFLDDIVIIVIIILLGYINTSNKQNHTYLLYRQLLELREPVVHQVPQ